MQIKKVLGLVLFFAMQQFSLQAQLFQTVRGTVVDAFGGAHIANAEVKIKITNSDSGTIVQTDSNGKFIFPKIALGRISIEVNKEGYYPRTLSNILVVAGKETIVSIDLEENIVRTNVQINWRANKQKPLNANAMVSSRQFSVEETQRYAAAVNDPLRMAVGFAGVLAPDDGNNMIVIRGNSPNGLIWRMEGMDIPNPNHFSSVGTSGGGISILSAQVLKNGDFHTGAFPAEYGNGMSGVFDISLRNGNTERRENTFQIGVLGVDFASEGKLGKKGGSYLANYRYSTLSVLNLIGVNIGDAVTNFQDLSYNIQLPMNKKSELSFFGFGGLSNQKFNAVADSILWKEESDKKDNWKYISNTFFLGSRYKYTFNPKLWMDIKLGYGYSGALFKASQMNMQYKLVPFSDEEYVNTRTSLLGTINYKFNSKSSIKIGAQFSYHNFNLNNSAIDEDTVMQNYLKNKGGALLSQIYAQHLLKISKKFQISTGVHAIHFALNNTYSIEPRIGLQYVLPYQFILSSGAGIHGQILPIGNYFYKDFAGNKTNQNLKMAKSAHFVFGITKIINKNLQIKTEVYYQHLYNLPVNANPTSHYSMVNDLGGYYTDTLVNKGLGRNKGVELTIERNFNRGFYALFTASLSSSRYKTLSNTWFHTRFDINRMCAITAGKEWKVNKNMLSLNIKLLYNGGIRDFPLDLVESREEKKSVYDLDKPYTYQLPGYFRIDTKISYKINRKKHTSTWSLDLQNATNNTNYWRMYFNPETGNTGYSTMTPLIPVLAYKLEF